MKKIVLFALGLFAVATTHAQEKEKIETTISGDIVSSYIWRGLDCGGVSIQPTLGVGYKGLSLTAWGSYGITNPDDTKEFDLTLAYSAGGFNIGITDYWFSVGLDPDSRYFKYDAHSTNHIFAEVAVPFKLATVDWTATAGAVPYATDFYGTTGFAVTNLTLRADKEIKITDSFSIPVFGQVTANPCTQKAYLVFGFTLHP